MTDKKTTESELLLSIHKLIYAGQYYEALKLIESVPKHEQRNVRFSFYKALCAYENGNDVECIRLLVDFLHRAPGHEKESYAKFTMAVCLENLGLDEEALGLYLTIPHDYPDLVKNLDRVNTILLKKAEAIEHLNKLSSKTRNQE